MRFSRLEIPQLLCFTGTASRGKLLASFVNRCVIIHSLAFALRLTSPHHTYLFSTLHLTINVYTSTMPPRFDKKLTPDLYEVFLSYKKATTVVERWLAVTSDRIDIKARSIISDMQQAASSIKDKRIKVPDLIYYAFDKAIAARSEVTSHFKGFFATKTANPNNLSHEHFTKCDLLASSTDLRDASTFW